MTKSDDSKKKASAAAAKAVRVNTAKVRALTYLNKCLSSHNTDIKDQEKLIIDVAVALGVRQGGSKADDASSSSETKGKRNSAPKQKSNTQCDVCHGDGELICCITCPLVFHSECTRPKLDQAPDPREKGADAFTCSYCVVIGVASSSSVSFAVAKQAVASMAMLNRGLDITDVDEHDRLSMLAGENGNTKKGNTSHEITVQRSGKRFIVRKTARSQIVELDRCTTLEDALASAAAELNPVSQKKRSLFQKDELYCMHCLDDPSIILCAFCGCRKCYGKHDSEKLLVCDGCDEEYHTYCLPRGVEMIPDHAWYCPHCVSSGRQKELEKIAKSQMIPSQSETTPARSKGKKANGGCKDMDEDKDRDKGNEVDRDLDAQNTPAGKSAMFASSSAGRGRGRPPGSLKKGKDGAGATGSISDTGGSSLDFMMVNDGVPPVFSYRSSSGSNGSGGDVKPLEKSLDPPPLLGAPGYDECINVINGKYRNNNNSFHCTEKDLLGQVRLWAPLGDLELTRDALLAKRDEVCKRIKKLDPFFKFPGVGSKANPVQDPGVDAGADGDEDGEGGGEGDDIDDGSMDIGEGNTTTA